MLPYSVGNVSHRCIGSADRCYVTAARNENDLSLNDAVLARSERHIAKLILLNSPCLCCSQLNDFYKIYYYGGPTKICRRISTFISGHFLCEDPHARLFESWNVTLKIFTEAKNVPEK
jgi:hypothetical protein